MNMYDVEDLLSQGFQVVIDEEDLEEFEEVYGDTDDLIMYRVNGEVWIKETRV